MTNEVWVKFTCSCSFNKYSSEARRATPGNHGWNRRKKYLTFNIDSKHAVLMNGFGELWAIDIIDVRVVLSIRRNFSCELASEDMLTLHADQLKKTAVPVHDLLKQEFDKIR